MKTQIILSLFCFLPASLLAQNSKAAFAKAIDSVRYGGYTLSIPDKMACDSVYEVFSKFKEFKGSRGKYNNPESKELGRMTSLTFRYKIQFYKELHKISTCVNVKEKLMEEFIYALKDESTEKNIFSQVLDLFQDLRNDKISKDYDFKKIMEDLMKREDINNSDYYSRQIISSFSLLEYIPRFWKIYQNSDESKDAFSKYVNLTAIGTLGDNFNVHHQYIQDIWEIVKSDEKLIDNEYLYLLISRIEEKKQSYRREKVEELFKILKYLEENPQKNKKIFLGEDSVNGRIYLGLDEEIYFCIIDNVKLNKEQFNFKNFSKEKQCELLKWYKKHSNFELLKGRG